MKPVFLKTTPALFAFGVDAVNRQQAHLRHWRGGAFLQPQAEKATAVITGASAGIGAEFARQLATSGYHLVLVARRLERLQSLAEELQAQHGVTVTPIAADLAAPEVLTRLAQQISALPSLEILVNNAGFGLPRPFARQDPALQVAMVQVHDAASVALTRAALPGMLQRRRGGVINVSSVASFLPLRSNAIYSASKAFLNVFSEGVQDEVRGSGVYLQSLCPGFTITEFHDSLPGYTQVRRPAWLWMQAKDVVRHSIQALGNGSVIVVPGWHYRVLAFILRTRIFRPFVRLGAWFLMGEGVMHR